MKQSFCRLNRLGQCVWCLIAPIWVVSASAGTVTWDGGGTGGAMGAGWQWGVAYPTAWSTDVNPGANDDAVFPATLTRTSITLYEDTTLDRLIFDNQGSLSIGGTTLTITTRDILVRNSNNALATNKLTNIKLANNGIISVDAPKELRITTEIKNDGQAYSLTKQGSGILWLDGTTSCTGSTIIAEGTVHINSYNAQLKGYNIVVGDGVHAATLDMPYAGQSILGVPAGAIVTVNTNGLYSLNSPAATKGTFYPETYVINGGTFNLGGNALYMYNVAVTSNRSMSITMTGGAITNGSMSLPGPSQDYTILSTKASSATAQINTDILFGGSRSIVSVEDGAAPIDLEMAGFLCGNMLFRKTGAGVMALTRPTGNTAYRVGYSYLLDAGTLLVDNVSGTGTGSNGVTVAGGATLGGTGKIFGLQNQAHITLGGSSASLLATIAPGTLDRTTGEELCGTLTLGNVDEPVITNAVVFGNYSLLRAQLGKQGSGDRLAVYGNLKLDSALNKDYLNIVAPAASVPSGEHVLVTFSNVLSGRFDSVTFNGDPLPSRYKLEYRDASNQAVVGTANITGGSIVLIVPPTETLIIIH